MKTVRLIVLGALGRMGRAILDAMANDPSFRLQGAVVRERAARKKATLADHGLKTWGKVPLHASPQKIQATRRDVIVDVTQAESVGRNVSWAAKVQVPYVLAVTGLDSKTEKMVEKASKKIPIVVAPNLSIGMAILNEIAWIAGALMPDADIEIVETHHRDKKDAPSGTAIHLAKSIVDTTRRKREIEFGRPKKGKRKSGAVAIHSVRGGDVVGEHRIQVFSDGERLELGHVASSRAIFARGALKAAKYIVGKRPGLYTMRDVLGLGKGAK